MQPTYKITRKATERPLDLKWEGESWNDVPSLAIDNFRIESSSHHPVVNAKAFYTPSRLHILFKVEDRYIRSTRTIYQDMVCNDSCVEFFVRPDDSKGYVNFEINCGGTLHSSYIEDWDRKGCGFKKWTPVANELGASIQIDSTMPRVINDELTEPTTWYLSIAIPFNVLSHYVGDFGESSGQKWRANFFKCGDETSHPHWAAWSPVKDFNFHDPNCFGTIEFE